MTQVGEASDQGHESKGKETAQVGEASNTGHESEGICDIIDVTVRSVDYQTHTVSTQMSVQILKDRIASLNGIPREQQHLIHGARVLQDDQLLSSYHIQNGDTLYLICHPHSVSSVGSPSSRPGVSRSLGVQAGSDGRHDDGISPHTQQRHPNSLQILPRYLQRMRREYSTIETGDDALRSAFSSYTPSLEEVPGAEQLVRLLSSTRDMLINQTSQRILELEVDLRHNLNVADPRVRQRTQLNAQKNGRIFNRLGAYFLELGRTMMQVEMGDSKSTATVNAGPPFYITDLGPNPLSIEQVEGSAFVSGTSRQRQVRIEMITAEAGATSQQTLRERVSLLPRLLLHIGRSVSVDGMTDSFQNMPSQHQHEQATANIIEQTNTELIHIHGEEKSRILSSPDGDVHAEEVVTPEATTNNDTNNMGTNVSSGPSTLEYRSAHGSSIAPSDENIGTSLQQDDVAQSQPQIKRQKME